MNNFQKASLQLGIGLALMIVYFSGKLIGYSIPTMLPFGLIGGVIGVTSIYWYLKEDTPIALVSDKSTGDRKQ